MASVTSFTALPDIPLSPANYLAILTLTVSILFVRWLSAPTLSPREPPLIKPTIPFLGHILSFLRQGLDFHPALYKTHPLPIATLPFAEKRAYVITSPGLVHAAQRNRDLSYEVLALEFAQGLLGVSDDEFATIPGMIHEFFGQIAAGMVGEGLKEMNARALGCISTCLDGLPTRKNGEGEVVENLWEWVRELITLVTTESLYGSANPFRDAPLARDLWTYDSGSLTLVANIFPRLLAPRAVAARRRIQEAMGEYYAAGHDQDENMAARVVQNRGRVLRTTGKLGGYAAGKFDFTMAQVAVINSAPMLFWLLAQVVSQPKLVERLRAELEPLVEISTSSQPASLQPKETETKRRAILDTAIFPSQTPLLHSCWLETLRWAGRPLSVRRVARDTTLCDAADDGKKYFLRAGSDVHMPAAVTHMLPHLWGPHPDRFEGDRFLSFVADQKRGKGEPKSEDDEKHKKQEKERKMAFFPFGGGKHLCPGRTFAITEILSLVATLVVGFDIRGLGDGEEGCVPVPDKAPGQTPLHGMASLAGDGKGLRVTIHRRKGWEDVEWKYLV